MPALTMGPAEKKELVDVTRTEGPSAQALVVHGVSCDLANLVWSAQLTIVEYFIGSQADADIGCQSAYD